MSTTNSLWNVAERALRALDSEEFPLLKADLKEAIDQEHQAANKHAYSLKLAKGGIDEFTVYFDVEQGDAPDEWVVAEGLQAFYKGVEITDLFEGEDLDEGIYLQREAVEQQMADSWANHMIDKYADTKCD
jgi:hypothetical protein